VSSYLLLHGWQNRRPAEHWQSLLAAQLRERGHRADHPQLPDPDAPSLPAWLDALDAALARLRADGAAGERVVVAHSLGCLLWLHAAGRDRGAGRGAGAGAPVDRVLLVSPPGLAVLAGIAEVAGFAAPRVDAGQVAAAAGSTRVVAGGDDPYLPDGVAHGVLRPLGLAHLDVDVVPGGGHLDLEAGYGDWPSALAWCEDPSVRLVPRP